MPGTPSATSRMEGAPRSFPVPLSEYMVSKTPHLRSADTLTLISCDQCQRSYMIHQRTFPTRSLAPPPRDSENDFMSEATTTSTYC